MGWTYTCYTDKPKTMKEKRNIIADILVTSVEKPQFGNVVNGIIIKNDIEIAKFSIKKFNEGSQYGINGGKISKLFIQDSNKNILACYDRGWDIKPHAEAKEILEKILEAYN